MTRRGHTAGRAKGRWRREAVTSGLPIPPGTSTCDISGASTAATHPNRCLPARFGRSTGFWNAPSGTLRHPISWGDER
jgi:hypothetical protein